jgi:hypothetical protein
MDLDRSGITDKMNTGLLKLTVHLERLARLGLDPFAVDVANVLLQKGRVLELNNC